MQCLPVHGRTIDCTARLLYEMPEYLEFQNAYIVINIRQLKTALIELWC